MAQYNFKEITVVPNAKHLIDIVLSRTQRKTPTVVHKRYKISRIRSFYMRKVKFTQSTIRDRLTLIIDNFPRINDIHPFYKDLIHILYDSAHYKLALGQLNTCRSLIDAISRDIVTQLKYGDSLFRCKRLKRSALGRMCTLLKKQDASLKYLEQVRQHLSRLPSINPLTRTLILTGFPNAGKSSFINKVSRAKVDVQPYPFTTKSIFVGHMDYKYLRWQVLDTPGILDHPLQVLDGCNSIEMQAITALAHIHACVVFFIDLSPHCDHSIASQVNLFKFLKPIFNTKPIVVVANKIDLRKLQELDAEELKLIDSITKELDIPLVPSSNISEEGIKDVKRHACERLLEARIENKMRTKKVDAIANRITVATPVPRDNKTRGTSIPASVLAKRASIKAAKDAGTYDADAQPKRRTLKDLELENGGAGVFHFEAREHWKLENPEWQFDRIPEIYNGQNIADWLTPDADIDRRLDELEREEDAAEAEAEANMGDEDGNSSLDEDEQELYDAVLKKRDQQFADMKVRRNQNKPGFYRQTMTRTSKNFESHLENLGIDASKVRERVDRARERARSRTPKSRKRGRNDMEDDDDDESKTPSSSMRDDGDDEERPQKRRRSMSTSRSLSVRPNGTEGLRDTTQKVKATRLEHKSQVRRNKQARNGPGDHRITTAKPKHLFSGKRGIGKTDRR